MKKTIAIALAILISSFATIASFIAPLVLVFIGSILCSRVYLQAKTLPQAEAVALKSSTSNRVGQVLIMVPILTVIFVFTLMSGVIFKWHWHDANQSLNQVHMRGFSMCCPLQGECFYSQAYNYSYLCRAGYLLMRSVRLNFMHTSTGYYEAIN